jgi:molybdopterin converting factor subunit 1
MRVTIRFFAQLRHIAGADAADSRLPPGSTVKDLWQSLVTDSPGLARFESTVSVAVNEEYARMTRELRDGDEVAFLPPVSGG